MAAMICLKLIKNGLRDFGMSPFWPCGHVIASQTENVGKVTSTYFNRIFSVMTVFPCAIRAGSDVVNQQLR